MNTFTRSAMNICEYFSHLCIAICLVMFVPFCETQRLAERTDRAVIVPNDTNVQNIYYRLLPIRELCPYAVYVWNWRKDISCTGVILNRHTILTDASCTHGGCESLCLGLGYLSNKNMPCLTCSRVIVFPMYNYPKNESYLTKHSLSIVKVLEPIDFNEDIEKIELGALSKRFLNIAYCKMFSYVLLENSFRLVFAHLHKLEECYSYGSYDPMCAFGKIPFNYVNFTLGSPLVCRSTVVGFLNFRLTRVSKNRAETFNNSLVALRFLNVSVYRVWLDIYLRSPSSTIGMQVILIILSPCLLAFM